MATQVGLIKLKGRLGDLVFLKTADGYIVKGKGGADAERIKTHPRFQRTRENMSEFGLAASTGAQLRKLLAAGIGKIKSRDTNNRLTKAMKEVINGDEENKRGERTVVKGDLSRLRGFEFVKENSFSGSFRGKWSLDISRVEGKVSLVISPFGAETELNEPPTAGFYRFVLAALHWDIEGNGSVFVMKYSSHLPIKHGMTEELNLSVELGSSLSKPVVVVLGLDFAQEVSGDQYVFADKKFMCRQVVEVG